MTVVLDAQGLTMLAQNRARLEELRRRGEWPAFIPTVVVIECLTGDHRRAYHENRVVRACDVKPVDEPLAHCAALLRSKVVARRAPSVGDAIVVALADFLGGATVLGRGPADLEALARHTVHRVDVAPA